LQVRPGKEYQVRAGVNCQNLFITIIAE